MKNQYRVLPVTGIARHYCILSGFVVILTFFTQLQANAQSMGISSSAITPDASSIMEMRTTTKGLLIPRMTTTERDAISSPATGLMVYNTTTGKFNFYSGSSWTAIFSGTAGVNSVTGTGNRITIGGTAADPTVDISSSYVGQTSLTTLGTISTGVWNGTALTSTYLPSAIVFNNQANSFTAGSKQTFQGSASTAGLNFAGISSDPSSLSNGDVWHNTTVNTLKYRANGTTRTIANLDESQTLTNKDITSGTNTFPTLNQNTTGSAGTLTTSRLIHGGSFNGSADVTNIIASTYGGTGNGFAKLSGPATSEKTFTLPNASATILTDNAAVTVAQGGTGVTTLASNGMLYGNGTGAVQALAVNSSGTVQYLSQVSSGTPAWASITTLGTITTGVWNGTALTSTYLPSASVFNNQANTFTSGSKQTFQGSASTAGVNFGGISSDPSSLSNGDMWHNTTSNTLKYRSNGTTRTIANLDESQTLTNKDLTSGTNTFPTLNQNTTGSAGTLTTSRLIHGGSFNGSGDVTNIIASTYGGTGNGFAKFTGPASSEKTFTLPNVSATILTSNAVVTIGQGGTNSSATPTSGGVGYGDGSAHQFTSAGTAGQVLQSNATGAPIWVNGGTMILTGISNNIAVNNTTLYYPISGILAGSATDLTAGTRTMVSRSGTVANLYVRLSAAIGSGKTGTVTVYKNGIATALTVTLTISGITFTDNADAFTVVAGDELSVKVTTTGNVKFSWAADLTY